MRVESKMEWSEIESIDGGKNRNCTKGLKVETKVAD